VNAALEDSILLAGSEAYQAALLFYGSVKTAKARSIGDASLVYDELAVRFPGASGTKAARA